MFVTNGAIVDNFIEHRLYLTEDDFDAASEATKMLYRYCEQCGRFYLKSELGECQCYKQRFAQFNLDTSKFEAALKEFENLNQKLGKRIAEGLARYGKTFNKVL